MKNDIISKFPGSSGKTGTSASLVNSAIAISKTIPARVDADVYEIIFLTSYPPRECGIATYAKDLAEALTKKFNGRIKLTVVPLESNSANHNYSFPVRYTINTSNALDYIKASFDINSNPQVSAVLVQHEFGLYKDNECGFLEFLEFINKPILITFHTIIPGPNDELRQKVWRIAKLCDGIIVMTKNSADILIKEYRVSPEKITVIPHGTHLVHYEDKDLLKEKYGLTGKKVLSTFGLLGPNKSIETTLNALPKVIEQFPETIFLVMGRTHPVLVKEEGEEYRDFLEAKVSELQLTQHVRFINQFLPIENLLEYLQLTDIYLFTSKDPNQAVSGTFSYAISCGCPVISTPIPHAREVLQNGAGIIVEFENPHQLQQAIIKLLENEDLRQKLSINGLNASATSAWENAAIAHAKVIEKIGKNVHLNYRKPPVNLAHIKKLTTDVGIIQFSKINHPDVESGYTLDDNTRAMIALCQHYELTGDKEDLKYIKTYFNFIFSCFRSDGNFLNYVDKEYKFTEQNEVENLEDARGRAIWALGYLLSISDLLPEEYRGIEDKARFLFEEALKEMNSVQSPRGIAFIIKGLYYYSQCEDRNYIHNYIIQFADRLTALYRQEASENWHWFEGYLTYGNAVIPQALLMAYTMTLHDDYRRIAKESFDFLLSKIFTGNSIRVISNQNWLKKDEEMSKIFRGGEQPIDVAYTILALRPFHKIFPNCGYSRKMEGAFNWFMGDNSLNQTLYNPCTAGCYDGLELHNVNLNQGAESTISYLLARMAFEQFPRR